MLAQRGDARRHATTCACSSVRERSMQRVRVSLRLRGLTLYSFEICRRNVRARVHAQRKWTPPKLDFKMCSTLTTVFCSDSCRATAPTLKTSKYIMFGPEHATANTPFHKQSPHNSVFDVRSLDGGPTSGHSVHLPIFNPFGDTERACEFARQLVPRSKITFRFRPSPMRCVFGRSLQPLPFQAVIDSHLRRADSRDHLVSYRKVSRAVRRQIPCAAEPVQCWNPEHVLCGAVGSVTDA